MEGWLVEPYVVVIYVLIMGGLMGLSIWRAIVGRRETLSTKAWPETKGKILHTEVERYVVQSQDNVVWHFANIDYEYVVGEMTYRGNRYRTGERVQGSERKMQKLIDQYIVGTAVPVYYNPANPEEAVLSKEGKDLSRVMWLSAIFWFMFLACGVTAMIGTV